MSIVRLTSECYYNTSDCNYNRAVEGGGGGELAPVEASGEQTETALVVRAASPVRVVPQEKEPEAPAAAASPLDVVVEAHDEPSVASQV